MWSMHMQMYIHMQSYAYIYPAYTRTWRLWSIMLAMPPANLIFMWEKSSSLSPNKLMGRSWGPANTRMIVLGRKPCKFRASVRLNQSQIYTYIHLYVLTDLDTLVSVLYCGSVGMRVYQYWAGSKICCFSSILKSIFVLDVVKPTDLKEHRNKSQLTSTHIPLGIEPKVWVVTLCRFNASQPRLLLVKVLKLRIFGCKGYFCGKAPRSSILVNSKATKWLAGEML